ncbi:hypothetical protein [Archangium gephyra]|uniref:Uncharacterized protein n=1 Tax=Archangium gephyra TaxID=48 RepID=A0AAC8Q887_9BACT|nr:hypothetical protein [Archangium gephyra]AKJ02664.1 Hypothetical protein AA314_04290 [Archangium gephyra]
MSKPLPFLVALVMFSAGPALATEPSAVRLHPRFQPCDDASCRAVSIAPKPQGCAKGECGPDDEGAYDVSTLPTAVVVPLYGSSTAVAQQLASLSRTEVEARARFTLIQGSDKLLEDLDEEMSERELAHTAMHAGFVLGSLPVLVKGDAEQLTQALKSGVNSLHAAARQGLDSRVKTEASTALSRAAQRQQEDGLIEKLFRQGHEGLSGERSLVHASFSLGMWTALALDSGGESPVAFSALGRNLALMLEKDESLQGEHSKAQAVRGIVAELDKGASRSQETLRAYAESLLKPRVPQRKHKAAKKRSAEKEQVRPAASR